jgi:hypothetical protein
VAELIEGEDQEINMANLELVDTKRPALMNAETTDMALFVRTSAEEMDSWDRSRIEEALIRETQLDDGTAKEIAAEGRGAAFQRQDQDGDRPAHPRTGQRQAN